MFDRTMLETRYGALPADLGLIDLRPEEMLFWMYCPIYVPGPPYTGITIPANLYQFKAIVDRVLCDLEDIGRYYAEEPTYIYLTAKTLWVSGDYIGNRPGWHSDGFGTDDLNYIWSDRAPTEFVHLDPPIALPPDCKRSMFEMERQGQYAEEGDYLTTFPDKHLLRLDQSVIHRSPAAFDAGMRTFVKVSVSKDRYDLKGNSINHGLVQSRWPLSERKLERNHPQSVKA